MIRLAGFLVVALLAACSREADVRGSPVPTAELGAWVARPACPSVQGVFEWPPSAGAWRAPTPGPFRTPWAGGVPVEVPAPEAQIWVRELPDGGIEVRSRPAHRPSRHHEVGPPAWRVRSYAKDSFHCEQGVLRFREVQVPSTPDDGTDKVRRGFALARLEDGALAVGWKTVHWGRRSAIFQWGDASIGTIAVGDGVIWHWSRLEPLAPGGEEPPLLPPSQRYPATHLGWR